MPTRLSVEGGGAVCVGVGSFFHSVGKSNNANNESGNMHERNGDDYEDEDDDDDGGDYGDGDTFWRHPGLPLRTRLVGASRAQPAAAAWSSSRRSARHHAPRLLGTSSRLPATNYQVIITNW